MGSDLIVYQFSRSKFECGGFSHPIRLALLGLGVALLLSAPASPVFAANAAVKPMPIRGEVIIKRTASA